MKAAVLYRPLDLRLEEREIPRPGPGEITIKVHTSGLCPSDVRIYKYGRSNVNYPIVLGHEVSGYVYEVGDGVEGFRPGDMAVVAADAYCGKCESCIKGKENLCEDPLSLGYNVDGAHSDYMLVPSRFLQRGGVLKIESPELLEAMSMAEPLACTVHSIRQLNLSYGDSMLVIGDGPMGLMHVIAAKAFGINDVTVIGLNEWKLKLAEELGATRVYQNGGNTVGSIKNDLKHGFDGVSVTVVNEQTVQEALELAAYGGKVNIFAGLPPGRSKYSIDSNIIHYGEVSLQGSYGYTYQEFKLAYRMLKEHSQEMLRLVSHRFMLEDIHKAISVWDDKDSSLKILISRRAR